MKARDYQLEAVEKIRAYYRAGHYYALVQAPTGSGKTVIASEFVRQMVEVFPDYRVVVIVPKLSIIDSFADTLAKLVPHVSVSLAASSSHGTNITGQIVVGSYQTLSRAKGLEPFHLIIADEAHKINERDEKSHYFGLIKRLMGLKTPDIDPRVLALTATPFRDTGFIYGTNKIFKELVFKRDLLWTTEMGFTVKAVLMSGRGASFDTTALKVDNTGEYAANAITKLTASEPKARAQVLDILSRTSTRKKIAIACAGIEHAELIKRLLEEQGEWVEIVHSLQDWDERDISLGCFVDDPVVRFVVFVSVIAEGFDCPKIDCIVLLRPTRRANLYVQICGRGLRPYPEKENCLILDYGNVIKNCGPLDAPFVNESGGKRGLEKAQAISNVQVIQCLGCGAFFFPSINNPAPKCTHCEAVHTKATPDPGKKLGKKAASDVELYSESILKKKRVPRETLTLTVRSLHFKPCGKTIMENHEKKLIKIFAEEFGRREFKLVAYNPAIPHPGREHWQIAKDRDMEPKLEKLLSDCFGEPFNLRNLRERQYTPYMTKKRIVITCTVKPDDADNWIEYKSHEIKEESQVAAAPVEMSLFADYSVKYGEDT